GWFAMCAAGTAYETSTCFAGYRRPPTSASARAVNKYCGAAIKRPEMLLTAYERFESRAVKRSNRTSHRRHGHRLSPERPGTTSQYRCPLRSRDHHLQDE